MKWQWVAAVILAAVGVSAVALVIVRPSFGSSDTSQYLTATATRANVVDDVAADGSLVATARYGLSFGSNATLLGSNSSSSSASSASSAANGTSNLSWPVTAVKIVVGQAVKKGDLLATADSAAAKMSASQKEIW